MDGGSATSTAHRESLRVSDRWVAHDGTVTTGATSTVAAPERAERRAACLAMVAYWLCDIIGPPLVLWWARRRGSTFARRYAWTSLALNLPVLVGFVLWVPAMLVLDGLALLVAFAALWLTELTAGIVAIQLAVRAWRGEDVRHALLPDALLRRLPTEPAGHR